MENRDRLQLIKSLKYEIIQLEEGKKQIIAKIKEKKELQENLTNTLVNELLKEEKKND
jgi:hypothetical protein